MHSTKIMHQKLCRFKSSLTNESTAQYEHFSSRLDIRLQNILSLYE
jgi:hypothetical protein